MTSPDLPHGLAILHVLINLGSSSSFQVQSAFMIDLAQVSLALRNCTARSLLLLDEFGKGTLSAG